MEAGIIYTKDKKDIEVFFLKPQTPPMMADDEFLHDFQEWKLQDKDCCEDLYLMNEQDVNENSAGEEHSCPVGHKGETGWQGYNSVYDAIFDTIKGFENSKLNIASETAQEILAMSIEQKVKHFYEK